MIALPSPREAYRRVEFDARVAGAAPRDLVALCFEQLVTSLGTALVAHRRGDNRLKSQSLTRALSALTALELGVRRDDPLTPALLQLYGAARRAVLDSVPRFDPATIARIRDDFNEIGGAFGQG